MDLNAHRSSTHMLIPLDFKGFFFFFTFSNSDYKRQSAIQYRDSLPRKLVWGASGIYKSSWSFSTFLFCEGRKTLLRTFPQVYLKGPKRAILIKITLTPVFAKGHKALGWHAYVHALSAFTILCSRLSATEFSTQGSFPWGVLYYKNTSHALELGCFQNILMEFNLKTQSRHNYVDISNPKRTDNLKAKCNRVLVILVFLVYL